MVVKRSLPGVLLALCLCVSFGVPSLAQSGLPGQKEPLDASSWHLFERVYKMVLRDYVDPKSPREVIKGALEGAAESVGPECAYIPREEVPAYRFGLSFGPSLPLYVTKHTGFARVLAFYPGSGKGVLPGHYLRFIGNRSTYDMTYPQILAALRSKQQGKSVRCIFINSDSWQSKELTLKTSLPIAPRWTSLPGGSGALAIPCLQANLTKEEILSIKALRGAAVVDLRGCASGSDGAALKWIGVLLGPGRSPKLKGAKSVSDEAVTGPGYLAGKALCVIVDGTTARGGELLASALAGAGAVVVGGKTYGWAPRIESFPLKNGGLLRLITAYYTTPDGKMINNSPIKPVVAMVPKKGESNYTFYRFALKAAGAARKKAKVNGR